MKLGSQLVIITCFHIASNAFVLQKSDGSFSSSLSRLYSTLTIEPVISSNVQAIECRHSLTPISLDPIISVSSRPILDEEECQTLSMWFRQQEEGYPNLYSRGFNLESHGEKILQRLQRQIVVMIGEDERQISVKPRFISYQTSDHTKLTSATELLPDGLHVDTNNGKYFRYLTVLVYLTSSKAGGATTFPLARPLGAPEPRSESRRAQRSAAQDLLANNILHTGFVREDEDSLTREKRYLAEHAAWELYQLQGPLDDSLTRPVDFGVRVLPRAGHIVAFCNMDATGLPDPMAFHAGEVLQAGQKEALTFFYEIPQSSFITMEDFCREVKRRRQQFLLRLNPPARQQQQP